LQAEQYFDSLILSGLTLFEGLTISDGLALSDYYDSLLAEELADDWTLCDSSKFNVGQTFHCVQQ